MTPDFTDTDYPADPYPGTRPEGSFVDVGQVGYLVSPNRETPSGWDLRGEDLNSWLQSQQAKPLGTRLPVLAYGSNVNPSKITWLRQELGLTGPAVVMQARCHGVAAVWSAGIRARDGQRPAVLAGYQGYEDHAVWFVTPDQRRVLDRCEGRGQRYRLSWLRTPITLENGAELSSVLAYTARPEAVGLEIPSELNRSPLLVSGQLVRCAELGQEEAIKLTGEPAPTDGLTVTEVHGEPVSPHPTSRVFGP